MVLVLIRYFELLDRRIMHIVRWWIHIRLISVVAVVDKWVIQTNISMMDHIRRIPVFRFAVWTILP